MPTIQSILTASPRPGRYGAPLGDCDRTDGGLSGLYLQRVPLIDGDYAHDGTYWGGGDLPLWCAFTADGQTRLYRRALTRAEAAADLPEGVTLRRSAADPRIWWTCGAGLISLRLTRTQARGASHSGDCESDVDALAQDPDISAQLSSIKPADAAGALRDFGAWDDADLADHAANLRRLLWIAAGDIADGSF